MSEMNCCTQRAWFFTGEREGGRDEERRGRRDAEGRDGHGGEKEWSGREMEGRREWR